MRQRVLILAAVLLAVTGITGPRLAPADAQKPAAQELLLLGANIVDPRARTIRKGNLLIRDGVIVATPATPPRGFTGQRIDLAGKWVIPGLNDMHVHSFGNPPFGPESDTPGTAAIAERVLRVGVTGMLDLFGDEPTLDAIRTRQRAGELGGADLFASLSCLTAPKGHCTEYGVPTRTLSTPAEARAVVADLARKRPDVIKIVYQTTGSMPSIDTPTFNAAVAEARAQGLKTIIHIDTWGEVEDAIRAGASAVTHIPDAPIPPGMAERMAKSGIVWIPTLAVETEMVAFAFDPEVLANPMARAMTKPSVIAAYRTPEFLADFGEKRAAEEARNAIALANVRAVARAGGRILLGTDAGNWGTIQGYAVHRELTIMVEAGLTPWQALASSTTHAGDFLGHRFGVTAGSEANLVVLNASPIANIRNTQHIAMVIHHGRIVDLSAR